MQLNMTSHLPQRGEGFSNSHLPPPPAATQLITPTQLNFQRFFSYKYQNRRTIKKCVGL